MKKQTKCARCGKKLRTFAYGPYCRKCFDTLYHEAIEYLGKEYRMGAGKLETIELYLHVKKIKEERGF